MDTQVFEGGGGVSYKASKKPINLFALLIILVIASLIFYFYAWPIIDNYLKNNIWLPIMLGVIVFAILLIIIYKIVRPIRELLKTIWIKIKGGEEGINTTVTTETGKRIPLNSKHQAALLERSHHRCQIPYCMIQEYPQFHHIDKNNRNAKSSNLIVLCTAHHKDADHDKWRKPTLAEWNCKNNYYDYQGNRRNNWSNRQIKDSEFIYNYKERIS